MEAIKFDWIQLIGGLGTFIFGMKLMSESLEKAAGSNLKKLLSTMTSNRFFAVTTGFLITCVIQSSSATTVMVVSFVNAGLLNLAQSIGIIMGANIGTTLTAWIVNLTHLKAGMITPAFIGIAVGIVFLFVNNNKIKTWGQILIGFGLLFIGLDFLKDSVPSKHDMKNNLALFEFFSSIPNNYWSWLLFVLIGTLFTIVLQSSSATMAVTIAFVNSGYIGIYQGIAMVLGENIGTTITANLAGLAGNRMAKKAALSHTIFNVIGVSWMMLPFVFPNFVEFCGKISDFAPKIFPHKEGIQLAVFHTLFNIINTFIFIGFIKYLEIAVNKVYGKSKEKKILQLTNIKAGIINMPDVALLEAQNEVVNMATKAGKMFNRVLNMFNGQKIQKQYDKIKSQEEKMDKYEEEIYSFLVDLLREDTSVKTTDKINNLIDQIRYLEWVGDSCDNIADLIIKAESKGYDIYGDKREVFEKLLLNLNDFFTLFINNITDLNHSQIVEKCMKCEDNINKFYKELKKRSISDMRNIQKSEDGENIVASRLIFMDIIKELEHIGDDLKNIIKLYKENTKEK